MFPNGFSLDLAFVKRLDQPFGLRIVHVIDDGYNGVEKMLC